MSLFLIISEKIACIYVYSEFKKRYWKRRQRKYNKVATWTTTLTYQFAVHSEVLIRDKSEREASRNGVWLLSDCVVAEMSSLKSLAVIPAAFTFHVKTFDHKAHLQQQKWKSRFEVRSCVGKSAPDWIQRVQTRSSTIYFKITFCTANWDWNLFT